MTTPQTQPETAGATPEAPQIERTAEDHARFHADMTRIAAKQPQHSPLPWSYEEHTGRISSPAKFVICDYSLSESDAKYVVRCVNSAEKLAEALRAWEYAGREGGISMVDWFEVPKKKTRAALAYWQRDAQ